MGRFLRKGGFLFVFLRVSAPLRCYPQNDAGESVTVILNRAVNFYEKDGFLFLSPRLRAPALLSAE